jgi:hypothetical protein
VGIFGGMKGIAKKEYDKMVEDMFFLGAKFRGEIIGSCVNIETILELIIAAYFTGGNLQKTKELLHTLISKDSGLRTKHKLISFILTKHELILKENKGILKEIDDIIQFRNHLAHNKIDMSPENLRNFKLKVGPVVFECWKTTRKHEMEIMRVSVSQREIDKQMAALESLAERLAEIHNQILGIAVRN